MKEKNLEKALIKFKEQYPNVTSTDLQTFILGWHAAIKYMSKTKTKIKYFDGKDKKN